MDPKITVVTPSFNQERFLEGTIQSVLGQGYPALEYILIDGGSTDGSLNIIERYERHFDYWVSEPDEGFADALRKGFSVSTGEVMCWLNSDDLHEGWTLKEVARYFTAHPEAQVVYGDATWIDAKGRFVRPKRELPFNRFIWFFDHNYIPQPSTFFRREIYQEVGGLDLSIQVAVDTGLWASFLKKSAFHHVDRPWSRMRLYPEQLNQRLRSLSDVEDRSIREAHLGPIPEWRYRLSHLLARGLRISWKAATGRYRARR